MTKPSIHVWELFQEAVDTVRDNLAEALRFSGVVFILSILVTSAIYVAMIGAIAPPTIDPAIFEEGGAGMPTDILVASLINGIISFVVFAWVAIEWHRFALGGVRLPSILPRWDTGRVMRYLGNTVLLGVMIAFAVAFPFGLLIGILGAIGLGGFVALLPLVMMWVGYYVIFRAGLILPAAALDEPMRLRESMNRTQDIAGPLWGLAGLHLAVSFFGVMIISFLPAQSIVGVVLGGAIQWFLVLLSASLLSSVYKATR